MPFWNDYGKHENYKAKMEQKMCIAKETPETSFDLMDCNLSEVPPGVFSMCRVFLKESLLLENNNLTSLRNGGSLMDLSRLLVLNLKDNKFSVLPDEIGCLTNLQDLNLENNRLKKLPVTFGKLLNLRRLNLKGNKLVVFPPPICCLLNLEYLNICDNPKIQSLSKDLSNLMQLKCLELDHSCVTYPSADICSEGVASIMQFLCSESGKEYVPVSSPVVVCKRDAEASVPGDGSSDLSASYLLYQRSKEKRQKDLLLMEEALKLNYETQTSSVAEANIRKQKLLEDITQEQERMENEIILLQGRKEKEKQTLMEILNKVEDHSAQLIKHLMLLNDRSKNLNQMLATLEKDRIENDEIFIVKQEELEQLRKKEILEAMSEILQREEKQRDYEMERNTITAKLQNEENECNMKLLSLFQDRELDHQIILNTLMEEEQYQKQAFEALQLQRDHQHAEIAHQIHLIEKELSSLTAAELKKKDLKLNTEVNTLAEHRTALAYLLTDLLSAKEKRETELKERLKQMELQRVNEMEDFWLIQYQKLLDRKPKSLIITEGEIDPLVKQVLDDVGAQLLIPLFAAKRITLSDLISFSIDDIKKIGILDETMCQNVLDKAWEVYKLEEIGDSKKLWHSDSGETTPSPPPSAPPPLSPPPSAPPPPLDDDQPHSSYEMSMPSAPPLSPEGEMKLWCQTECVICLDKKSSSVFLPCGHVCCCQICSVSVEFCPMCRATIASKFTLVTS